MKLVLEWIKGQGGLAAIEKVNRAKQEKIYGLMDRHPDFFKGTVQKDSRSWMNLTLRLPNEDLEKKFIAEAKAAGFVGLKGHRSVGGIRVSLYNAMTLEGTEKLSGFMEDFRKANG
jgi:phosphoserine aminotransferase